MNHITAFCEKALNEPLIDIDSNIISLNKSVKVHKSFDTLNSAGYRIRVFPKNWKPNVVAVDFPYLKDFEDWMHYNLVGRTMLVSNQFQKFFKCLLHKDCYFYIKYFNIVEFFERHVIPHGWSIEIKCNSRICISSNESAEPRVHTKFEDFYECSHRHKLVSSWMEGFGAKKIADLIPLEPIAEVDVPIGASNEPSTSGESSNQDEFCLHKSEMYKTKHEIGDVTLISGDKKKKTKESKNKSGHKVHFFVQTVYKAFSKKKYKKRTSDFKAEVPLSPISEESEQLESKEEEDDETKNEDKSAKDDEQKDDEQG